MTRSIYLSLAVILFCAAVARLQAQESQNDKPLGTWTKTTSLENTGEMRVKIDIKPDRLRCTVRGLDGYTFVMDSDYLLTRDGILCGVARIQGAPKKEAEGEDLMAKRMFICRCKVENKALLISDLKLGEGDKDLTKLFEGKYRKFASKNTTAQQPVPQPAVVYPYGPGPLPAPLTSVPGPVSGTPANVIVDPPTTSSLPPLSSVAPGNPAQVSAPPSAVGEQDQGKRVQELMAKYNTLWKEAKYAEALACATKALKLDPDNPTIAAAVYIAKDRRRVVTYQNSKDMKEKPAR